jgi:hypothetical protein
MDPMHMLLPEDEILLCLAVLVYGLFLGAVARLVYRLIERRAA